METCSPQSELLFEGFLLHLREQGFAVGTQDYFRLQAVLGRAGREVTPERLGTLLCPLFATSKEQQEQFLHAVDTYFRFEQAACDQEAAPGDAQPGADAPFYQKVRLALLLLGLLATILFAGLLHLRAAAPAPSSRTPAAQAPQPGSTGDSGQMPDEPPSRLDGPGTMRTGPLEPAATAPGRERVPWSAAALLPLLWLAAYEGYRLRRRRLVIQRRRGKRPPFTWPLHVPEPGREFLDPDELSRAARALRRRFAGEERELDLEGTVRSTIEALGYPTVRFRPRQRVPEYLCLIDRRSARDHLAALFAHMEAALGREGVYVTCLFFDEDPRVCRDETGSSMYLADVQHRCPDHRLLLFSTGEKLLDPLTGALAPWTEVFQGWRERVLLTPRHPAAWGVSDVVLSARFLVVPATLEGLTRAAEELDLAQPDREGVGGRSMYGRGVAPHGAVPDTVHELRAYLGAEGFQWLCACGVYPELQWDLTLHLGYLASWEGCLREETVLKLARLPWFRRGILPDELRQELLRELQPDRARRVRETLVRLLEGSPPPPASYAVDNRRLHLAVQRWLTRPDRRSSRDLHEALAELSSGAQERDYAVIRDLDAGAASSAHFQLPERLRRLLYTRGIPHLGVGTAVRCSLALLLSAALVGVSAGQERHRSNAAPWPADRPVLDVLWKGAREWAGRPVSINLQTGPLAYRELKDRISYFAEDRFGNKILAVIVSREDYPGSGRLFELQGEFQSDRGRLVTDRETGAPVFLVRRHQLLSPPYPPAWRQRMAELERPDSAQLGSGTMPVRGNQPAPTQWPWDQPLQQRLNAEPRAWLKRTVEIVAHIEGVAERPDTEYLYYVIEDNFGSKCLVMTKPNKGYPSKGALYRIVGEFYSTPDGSRLITDRPTGWPILLDFGRLKLEPPYPRPWRKTDDVIASADAGSEGGSSAPGIAPAAVPASDRVLIAVLCVILAALAGVAALGAAVYRRKRAPRD